jgi:hypothetical protein
MIAHLPKLHECIDDPEVPTRGQRFFGRCARHELVVKKSLSLRKSAMHDVFEFAGKLFLDVGFETT